MSDLVRSVSEIFNDSKLKQVYYNIPDYQRGYEWGENNVRLLLEDLKKFLEKIYISDTDKFIDDKLLAQKIVNTNINFNKCGKNKIKQNLYNKGIDSEDISHAISNIDYDVEFENAMYLAKKRYERIKNEDKRKVYQKISQHLAYKGFDYDTIKSVLNKILNFDEYDY